MADQQGDSVPLGNTPAADVEMGGNGEDDNTPATADQTGTGATEAENEDEGVEMAEIQPEEPKVVMFLDYLKSPIIELLVGQGEDQTLLTAHQALLTKSPFFEKQCEDFSDADSHRRITLADEDLHAMGSLLEYLYHGEYFPKRLSRDRDSKLEVDPTVPDPDIDGLSLLKHARVYTLADKFGLPELKSLAHSKIHRTESTARGEIAYARYVYAHTGADDATIRRPVAAFWAHRSHVMRHHAEAEFRAMCLEFPQFSFDVLSLVLDAKEKRSAGARGEGVEPHVGIAIPTSGSAEPRSARKRARVSHGLFFFCLLLQICARGLFGPIAEYGGGHLGRLVPVLRAEPSTIFHASYCQFFSVKRERRSCMVTEERRGKDKGSGRGEKRSSRCFGRVNTGAEAGWIRGSIISHYLDLGKLNVCSSICCLES